MIHRTCRMIAVVSGLSTAILASDFGAALKQASKARSQESSLSEAVLARVDDAGWQIIALSVVGGKLTDAELKLTGELPALESLTLQGNVAVMDRTFRLYPKLRRLQLEADVSESTLVALPALPCLESLALNTTSSPDAMIIHLKKLHGLRQLRLYAAAMSDAASKHIEALTELQKLQICGNDNLGDDGMPYLKALPKLRSLSINELGAQGVATLKEMPHLENLSVDRWSAATETLDFSVFAGMKSLNLGHGFSVTGKPVRLPRDLRRVKVEGWTEDDAKRGKFHLEAPLPVKLEGVWLKCLPGAMDLRWLLALPELKELTLVDPGAADYATLGKLKQLHVLTLARADCGWSPGNRDLEHLADLQELESLTITNGERISDDGVSILTELKALRQLDFGNSLGLTAAGLRTIWNLTRLRALSLGLPKETPNGSVESALTDIASLSELRELTLRGTISDAGLLNVTKLQRLRRLDLSGCDGYSDEALAKVVKTLSDLRTVVWSCGAVSHKDTAMWSDGSDEK